MGASMSCNYNADSEAPHQNHNTDKSKRLKSRAERKQETGFYLNSAAFVAQQNEISSEEVNEPEEEKFQECPSAQVEEAGTLHSSQKSFEPLIATFDTPDQGNEPKPSTSAEPYIKPPPPLEPKSERPTKTQLDGKRQDSEDKENQGEPGDRRENGDGNDKDPIKTYDFQSNKSQPWGAAVGFGAKPDKWKITRLTDGAQFHQRGVRKGWRVIKVNDIEVNEKNKDAVKTILRKGQACTITFDSRPDVPQKVNK